MEAATCIESEPYALQVTDDSMEPEFPCGCIVIVDPTGRVRDGAFVLAEIDSGFIFRKLVRDGTGDRLVALNPACQGQDLDPGLSAIKGIIVQRAGRRRRDHKRYD